MRALVVAVLFAMTGGCGKKKSGPTGEPAANNAPAPAAVAPPAPSGSPSDMHWNETVVVPPSSAPPYRHDFDPGPPAPAIADPDAVIARYTTECPKGPTTVACHDLRLQVEAVLLDQLQSLRDIGEPIEREWYRVAARAETPQLACMAVRQLMSDREHTPEDDAALLDAAESPAQSVREYALSAPVAAELRQRVAPYSSQTTGLCVEALIDKDPGPAWAGGYPGARYRYFASGPTRRWFTTSDPIDTVLAYFAKSGRPPLTKDELAAAGQKKMIEEVTRLSQQETKPGEELKQAAQLQAMAAKASVDWGGPLRDVQDIGEIRFVMIAPNQAIAIFKDDVLHATSIVATQVSTDVSAVMDFEKQKKQLALRQVFGM